MGRTEQTNLRNWAARLFEQALPALEGFTSPRAWAFAVLGLHEDLRVLHGDLLAARWRLELSERLLAAFRAHASPEWPWLEPIVSSDNARLPQALILSGRWLGGSPSSWSQTPARCSCGPSCPPWSTNPPAGRGASSVWSA